MLCCITLTAEHMCLLGVAGAAQALQQGETEVAPLTAAANFRRAFASQFGELHPDWAESGWQEATQAAARQYKFLLVYLHAAGHDDTVKFCRETLTAPEVQLCRVLLSRLLRGRPMSATASCSMSGCCSGARWMQDSGS